LESGECLWSIGRGLDAANVALFTSGSRLFVGTKNGTLLIINVGTGKVIGSLSGSKCALLHLFALDSELWAIDNAGWVHFWKLPNQPSAILSAECQCGVAQVMEGAQFAHLTASGVLWTGRGKVLEIHSRTPSAASGLALIARFDYELDLNIKLSTLTGITSINDGVDVITAHEDGCLLVWRSPDCEPKAIYKVGNYKITAIATTEQNFIWLGFSTGKMIVIDSKSWEVICEWKPHQTAVIQMSYYKRGQFDDGNPLYMPIISMCDSYSVAAWDGLVFERSLIEALHKRADEYCTINRLKVRVSSWNVDSQPPPNDASFWKNWLGDGDIYVIGIQEMVDLESKSTNAKLIINTNSRDPPMDDARTQLWLESISRALSNSGVICVGQQSMVGLMMAIFTKAELAPRIQHLAYAIVKTGLGGLHGNKGALVTRLVVDDTSLCFINCHLAAGHSQTSARNADVAAIIKNAKLPCLAGEGVFLSGTGDLILDHENCVLFGDLNYRLNIDRAVAEQLMQSKEYERLRVHDQLLNQRQKVFAHPLATFHELSPDFAPTYKYDRGTDTLDSSEKQRVPAYCDRILLRTLDEGTEITLYESYADVWCSDHRPVSATISVRIRKIDHVKRALAKLAIQSEWLVSRQ
jgi:endonuclease/exonuclease/phosphatase family metal-dependent hydrolase